jgi:thymidine kinase
MTERWGGNKLTVVGESVVRCPDHVSVEIQLQTANTRRARLLSPAAKQRLTPATCNLQPTTDDRQLPRARRSDICYSAGNHPRRSELESYRGGWIEIIAGGMFSGKSEELIRRLRRADIARQRVQVFKPLIDDRFSVEEVVTRDDRRLKAVSVATSEQLLNRVEIGVQVVGIDEVQFFDAGVVDVCMQLADAGIRVIAAGLDQDYMRRPFGPMPALLAVAEEVSKMHAVCVRCRGSAHYSQRVSGGNAQVEVGDSSYEARCRACYELYKAASEEDSAVQLTIP